MAEEDGRFRGDARRRGRPLRLLGPLAAVALLISGCSSEIAAWRSLRGYDVNDPNPKTAPFTGNLAKAFDKPYPNLASVPPPPTGETSTVEREKLTQSLIADRAATAALGPAPAVPKPPPPANAAAAAAPPAIAVAANPAPAATAAAPGAAQTTAAAQPPAALPAAAPPPAAKPAVPTSAAAAKTPARGGAAPRQAAAAAQQPLNSNLTMPMIPGPLPQPQTPQPPPAAPGLAAPLPPPLAAPPAEVATAMPQPPPLPPALPAIAAPPARFDAASKGPSPLTVATLDLAAAAPAGAGTERAQIARVAALYKVTPGQVRVVAFAAAPSPGGDALASYDAALDRAQEIAKALAAAGIPAARIATEANPASGRQIGRVEIQFAR